MSPTTLFLVLCITSNVLLGATFRDDFAVVFIDADSEAKLGSFPLNRALIARAVRQAAVMQARGMVLKFFYDQPKDEAGDRALSDALTNLPVALQARIDDSELHPNPLPIRFVVPQVQDRPLVSGRSGWLPLPKFSANACGVGFVDFDSTRVPLLETYQEKTVKSLVVCCFELATGKPAHVVPGREITIGKRRLILDSRDSIQADLPVKDDLAYVPFHRFLTGDIPTDRIRGKVVILGYDGPRIQSLPTAIGPARAHRLFVYVLQNLYDRSDR